MSIKTQYNKIGNKYVSNQASFFHVKEDITTKFILKNLPLLKNKTILDFGCGHGTLIREFKAKGAKKVYGIDVSRVMIEQAKKFLNQEKNLFVEDIQKTHFPKGFFDIAVGRFSLHYLPTFNKAYREAARILKPGGIFLFIVDHPLRDYTLKKTKDYWKKENVTIKLYGGNVSIIYPSHTIQDYFSSTLFKYFTLVKLEEGISTEAQTKKNLPDYLAIIAKKK